MTVVGFNFSRIHAQQKKAVKGDVKIGTNVKIDNVQKTNMVFDQTRSTIKVSFTYSVTYSPEVAEIQLQGDILFMQEQKLIDAVLKEWDEKKKVSARLSGILMNAIMQKSTIQAIVLSRDLGLPAPVPLPKVQQQKVTKKSAKAAEPAKK